MIGTEFVALHYNSEGKKNYRENPHHRQHTVRRPDTKGNVRIMLATERKLLTSRHFIAAKLVRLFFHRLY